MFSSAWLILPGSACIVDETDSAALLMGVSGPCCEAEEAGTERGVFAPDTDADADADADEDEEPKSLPVVDEVEADVGNGRGWNEGESEGAMGADDEEEEEDKDELEAPCTRAVLSDVK